MIGRIEGTLLEKNPPALLVDVQGIGYEVDVPMSTFYSLPATGEPMALLVHMVVREDAMLLYGFGTSLERTLFRALLKVNGIGAKVALSILSGMSADEFLACVAREDADALVRVPGIGKKTAERLLVELKDRVASIGTGATGGSVTTRADTSNRVQAEEALAALGYKPVETKRLLDQASPADQSVEEMIRAALQGANR